TEAPAPAEDSNREEAAPAAGQPEQADPAPAEQPAPKKVSVLNNSMTQGLADRVSRDLEGNGYELGEVGNFPEEVLPETTVFFPKGDAAAEAEARKIASELGGIARENIDSLPDKATQGRGLTVVLTDA
ncbi:LytR C-terminal domain-containing protein, partial [Corynebacterium sp. 11254D007CR]